MTRLVRRALNGAREPELFAALVQACKFCNMFEASVAAHQRARALDNNIVTAVYATHFHLGDYDLSLELAPSPYYMDAAILSIRGEDEEAIRRLREREARNLSPFLRPLISGLRAAIEHNREEVLEHAETTITQFGDPDAVCLALRHLAYIGEGERAVEVLHRVLSGGFLCYRVVTGPDPWWAPIREREDFREFVAKAKMRYEAVREAYLESGGKELLGV